MFICQIIASRGDGGLEKHVRELSASLVAQGHRVLVIGDVAFVQTLSAGVEYECLNMKLSRYNPLLLIKLYQCLHQYQFDIIHAQASKAASMLANLKRFIKIPMVATVHNIKRNGNVYRRFAHVICVSRHLAGDINTAGTEVIYNGIQTPTITPVDLKGVYQLPQRKPVICAIGRLVTAKGFDVLLEAVDGLDISLLIIGAGPESAALEKRVMQMKSNTHVRLIGHHDCPSVLMQAADGVVISSRREGFSYVLNEAIMAGVNVLSTDVPVANEVLPSALIVDVGDAEMMRERLAMLLRKPSYWGSLMQAAQQFAQQEMTVQGMTQKTAALYERLSLSKG